MDGVDQGEDGPPVYESLYPELEQACSHPKCDNDSPSRERLCEKCTPIMRSDAPDECAFCGENRKH